MTEADKRELDAVHFQVNHPAARYDDLPEEVQRYISNLELQIYDLKWEKAFAKPIIASAIGALFIFSTYKEIGHLGNFGYVCGVLLLTVPWFIFRRESRKNAEEFMPDIEDEHFASNPSNVGIRCEWELMYLSIRRRKRESEQ